MIETVIWHSLLPQTVRENIRKFRKFRKELKLSQSDLAKKCNLSSYMISKMERGKHDFRITEIEKISFGLNKKINQVIMK
jgi:predicted transcriptional regulator